MDGKRSNSPTGNPPSVGRTPTPSELANEIRELRKLLQKPDFEARIERVEKVANAQLLPYIQETGARYDTVKTELTRLGTRFEDATRMVAGWRDEIRDELADHEDRLSLIEDRGARHHVRLDTIDGLDLDPRLRQLEQHRAGDERELSITRTQQRRLDARAGVISTLAGGLAALLSHLIA